MDQGEKTSHADRFRIKPNYGASKIQRRGEVPRRSCVYCWRCPEPRVQRAETKKSKTVTLLTLPTLRFTEDDNVEGSKYSQAHA